jgi:hypothetical protein
MTAAKVNGMIRPCSRRGAGSTNLEQAGQLLGSLLDGGPHRLLGLDDVWFPEQRAPFTCGRRRRGRLGTKSDAGVGAAGFESATARS